MDQSKDQKNIVRDFKLTSLALKNRNTVFAIIIVIIAFGGFSYRTLPKELFPEVVFPYIMVQTLYPGNSPVDMENLVTRPIEKEIENVNGIKVINSVSSQGASNIFIEFNTDVELKTALSDVKDAVDNAKRELPNDEMLMEPMIFDIDFSEFPIINVNLSGDFSVEELRKYAEYLQDEIESVKEISRVDLSGLNDREIQVNVDQYKLEMNELSLWDVESAITAENISMSGGELKVNNTLRAVRTIGEFQTVDEIKNIIVKHENNNIVYLRDIAEVKDGFEESESYTRLNKQPVVSLQVIKKGGENLLNATDQIFEILDEAKATNAIPQNLNITLTNDQSDMIRKQLNNLENSMIMGIIFVILVLFFFLGTRNALFVGFAIPMSMFLSFVVLGALDAKINMIVLFSLILALGMLVDNAIVTVENIYRFIDNGYSVAQAARQATSEIAVPIITSTATTLAAFLPLAFWSGIVGEFMKYLPITLIIVLTSSLFVALVIIPVISSTFIKPGEKDVIPTKKRTFRIAGTMMALAIIFYLLKVYVLANLLTLFALIGLANLYFLARLGIWFKNVFLIKLENWYLRFIRFSLRGKNPLIFLIYIVFLLIFTMVFMGIRQPKILFFPDNDPSYINIIAELPIGTDIDATDSIIHNVEDHIFEILEPNNEIVKSVLTIVGEGARGEDEGFSNEKTMHKGLVTISFVDYQDRKGINTSEIMKELSDELIGNYPGIRFRVEKNSMGPPTGKAINLEVTGIDYDKLIQVTDSIQLLIENAEIEGIEGLKVDLDLGKPELLVSIDRDKARRFGLSTQQIAGTIRTALFGKEVGDFKVGEDEYPIQLRMKEKYRNNLSTLMNQRITFRSQSSGQIMQVPISAVANVEFSTTYGAVKRKDLERVITIYSNVLKGYNANEINSRLKTLLANYKLPQGYDYKFTGEQQEQEESQAFLFSAMIIAVASILVILITQFNSLIKPGIIIASVIFSTIGVFGGIATFKMDIIIIMTGVGIVSLAGVVVNNAIVLIDYIDLLKSKRRKELELDEDAFLPLHEATECIVQGGKTRLRPVLLTAITTILGLVPMAAGINIDFTGLFKEFKPNIYFGGDMVKFWQPISLTVIFGLSFATFLTLVIVPVMYRLATRTQIFFTDIIKQFNHVDRK